MFMFLSTILLVSAFCQIDRILPFILAERIKADLSLSDTQIGLMVGLGFALCHTLLSLPVARAADRGSPRFILIACILIWSIMTGLGGAAASFAFLAFTRLGVAIGEAGAIPTSHALIARSIRPDRRGLAIGLFSMGIPLGTMLGFAGGGAIADTLGWRAALVGAGLVGLLLALLVWATARPTPPDEARRQTGEPFFATSRRLLSSGPFRSLIVAAIALGFAASPFYAFSAPFLIRTHGFTTAQVGLTFGLLQGGMGVVGTLLGGRMFDRAVLSGSGRLLGLPAALLLCASLSTFAALFAPVGWVSISLFIPTMLGFSFMLPAAFGAAHIVAGPGNQALASSLIMMASGLLGPAIAPLFVGAVSDAAAAADIDNGLGIGLVIVPVASLVTGLAMLVANRRIARALHAQRGDAMLM